VRADLIDRVFADLRACRVSEYEALGLIDLIRHGIDPYTTATTE
jgi:hypothetical protein